MLTHGFFETNNCFPSSMKLLVLPFISIHEFTYTNRDKLILPTEYNNYIHTVLLYI